MKITFSMVGILLVSLTVSGCMFFRTDESKSLRPLGSALTKLSSEMESLVRYQNPPADATDEELLRLATKNDPGFLDTFHGYKIRVRSQDRHAILLLCSADGKQGLQEDLGCTPSLDRNLSKEDAAMPCDFSLSVELGCRLTK
ncbi:MAG: hypothetical protein KJ900_05160 [Proteobacteria bacterium]|nr:hypothetical protein [Desulfocapsa sp.]MBU3945019.1 hypothetical protein [Pseudomonadota bacterium]MCG2742414.1 hypothetical protein [Desulfobacteraceae bacterium]MBU4030500.1 hypothetical protein [Pseudomonadota bacterium]MBU4042270.1 hypothetical protein [Pseudomonadota bacterium]